MSRALASLVATLALAGSLLAAAPSGAAPASDPAHRAGPGYHQPKVGSCHTMTMQQFNRLVVPTASVSCSKRHTTKTLVVKRLTGKVDWNSRWIMRPIWATCLRKMNQALGGNDKARAMSSYAPSFFIPSPKERARGAKWLRCDVGLLGGRVLQPIPKKLDLGSPPLDEKFARCLNGPERRLLLTVCAKQHTYRVTGGFRFSSKKYPGERALTKAALRRCPELISSARWRYYIPPGPAEWRLGQRTIICYSKTKS